jgi:tetratricopeptide (TPR) repeat protein
VREQEEKKKVTEVKTVPIPFDLEEIKENITIITNTLTKLSKEQIINQAIQFHSKGNISEAVKYYKYFISQGFKDYRVFSNYGVILNNLGNLRDAEIYTRKAIEIKPDYADAHSNLGNILKDLSNLEEAELSTRKAIELNPNLAIAHLNLGSILIDLGKLQEAEMFTRNAIKLNPNLAMAHLNLGYILRDIDNLQEAKLSTLKAIELNPNHAMAHLNLGSILIDLGNLQEAELSTRKAIELNAHLPMAHLNLGSILIDLGNLQDGELSILKSIELNPDSAKAYYSLSLLKCSDENNIWQNQLFSKNILNNKSKEEQVDIYFARANILHKKKKYKDSSKCLQLANNLKLDLNPFNSDTFINKSRKFIIESDKQEIKKEYIESPESIFIVGMPRSGSTLLESILSMNVSIDDLGETDILEESFLDHKKGNQELTLAERYWNKIKDLKKQSNKTTNKNLYNYFYAGIITMKIPNAKIIHCYRNPLDNILSIYRAHFAHGNEYSSSLVDCANIYLNQEEIMSKYKNRFRSKIYDLNYDSLVSNHNKEIKSLINWLGWEWQESYLSPHLNTRSIKTRSNIEVRSPINSKSIGGWKNYKEMLKPAIEIITQTEKYQDIA